MDPVVVKAHIERSDAHVASAERLAALSPLHEWEVVVRFYAALHLLEAFLETKSKRVDTHSARARAINEQTELSEGRGAAFKRSYSRLRDVSEQIRYDAGFRVVQSHLDNARSDLKTVTSFVKSKAEAAVNPRSPQP